MFKAKLIFYFLVPAEHQALLEFVIISKKEAKIKLET